MSKALIVYGYYDEKDHYGALLDTIKKQVAASGISDIEVVNTFSFTQKHLQNNEQDLSAPTADWFRGHRTAENAALIKAEQDKVTSASHIFFLYPIWWETLPPYMMHWVSEVFRSVSFRVGQGGEINPQWIGDRKVMIITTAGFSKEIRRDCFKKALSLNSLKPIEEKPAAEIDRLMEMSQTYPLMMALQYSGLSYSEQLHICDVDKGDAPEVLAEVEKGITTFLQPTTAIHPTEKSEEALKQPKALLLSGGPRVGTSTATLGTSDSVVALTPPVVTGTPNSGDPTKAASVRLI